MVLQEGKLLKVIEYMKKGSVKKRKGTPFITIGLLLMAAALFLTGYNYWDGKRAELASAKILGGLDDLIERAAAENKGQYPMSNPYEGLPGMEAFAHDMETVEMDGYDYIGYVDIPSLNLRLPVMADWDYTRLKISPCRYSGSYYTNDLVIAAHNYVRHFKPLKGIQLDADVYFTNAIGHVYHYQVGYVETLRPSQVEDMVSGDWDLTLFTCTTDGTARVTVRCLKVE